jgi:sugar phosphate isomerase/epimerase
MEYLDQVEGMEVFQYMFNQIPAPLLDIELDTFYLEDTGRNPAETIRTYADRSRLLHLKDRHRQREKHLNTEIGSGTVDWPTVFEAAEEAKIEWYILEQDCEEVPVWESLEVSLRFIRKSLRH